MTEEQYNKLIGLLMTIKIFSKDEEIRLVTNEAMDIVKEIKNN